jgi:hypothetical protein
MLRFQLLSPWLLSLLLSHWSPPLLLSDAASISRPVRNDSEVGRALEWAARTDYFYGEGAAKPASNKKKVEYHLREPDSNHESKVRLDVSASPPHPLGSGNPECPLELELLWSTRLGASVYAAPIARRSMFAGGGGVQLVVPTFVRYLELIEGDEGLAPFGWPLAFDREDHQHGADRHQPPPGGNKKGGADHEHPFDDDFSPDDDYPYRGAYGDGAAGGGHKRGRGGGGTTKQLGPALFHGSAAVHDVNGDGHDDVCVADGDGNVYWVAVGEYGQYLHDYRISVPRLKVSE